MDAKGIAARIKAELQGRWDITNAHGVELRRCLVPPHRQEYLDGTSNQRVALWTVLEELPDALRGYKIVFDEASDSFGLGMRDNHANLIFLGVYGSFIDALEAM